MECFHEKLPDLSNFLHFPQLLEVIQDEISSLEKRETNLHCLIQEFEKKSLSSTPNKKENFIKLNVGGRFLDLRRSAFPAQEESGNMCNSDLLLELILNARWKSFLLQDKHNRIFFDIDLKWMETFLDYYRCQSLFGINPEVIEKVTSLSQRNNLEAIIRLFDLRNSFQLKNSSRLSPEYFEFSSIGQDKNIAGTLVKSLDGIFSGKWPSAVTSLLVSDDSKTEEDDNEDFKSQFSFLPLFIPKKVFIANRKSFHHLLFLIEDTSGNIFGAYSGLSEKESTTKENYIFPIYLVNPACKVDNPALVYKVNTIDIKDHVCENCTMFPISFEQTSFEHSDAVRTPSSYWDHPILRLVDQQNGICPKRWITGTLTGNGKKNVNFKIAKLEVFQVSKTENNPSLFELIYQKKSQSLSAHIKNADKETTSSSSMKNDLLAFSSEFLHSISEFPTIQNAFKPLQNYIQEIQNLTSQLHQKRESLQRLETNILIEFLEVERYLFKQHVHLGLISKSLNISSSSGESSFASLFSNQFRSPDEIRNSPPTNTMELLKACIDRLLVCKTELDEFFHRPSVSESSSSPERLSAGNANENDELQEINLDPIVYMNIGGEKLCCLRKTILELLPDSALGIRLSGRWKEQVHDVDDEGYLILDYPKELFLQLISSIRLQAIQDLNQLFSSTGNLHISEQKNNLNFDHSNDHQLLDIVEDNSVNEVGFFPPLIQNNQEENDMESNDDEENSNVDDYDSYDDHSHLSDDEDDNPSEDEDDDEEENNSHDLSNAEDLLPSVSNLNPPTIIDLLNEEEQDQVEDDEDAENNQDDNETIVHGDEASFLRSYHPNGQSSSTKGNDGKKRKFTENILNVAISTEKAALMKNMLDYLGVNHSCTETLENSSNTMVFQFSKKAKKG